MKKNEEIIDLLLKAGASFETSPKGLSPFHCFFKGNYCNTEFIKKILNNINVPISEWINQKDEEGNTPLLIELLYGGGDFDRLKFLLENGASLEVKNNKGQTPILLAAKCALQPNVFPQLYDPKHAHDEDNEGNNLLHYALEAQQCTIRVLKWIYEHKAITNKKNSKGLDPLKIAANHCQTSEVMKLLEQYLNK